MKRLYSLRPCQRHATDTYRPVAATCADCFAAAERQRDIQWLRDRQQAHAAYLESLNR